MNTIKYLFSDLFDSKIIKYSFAPLFLSILFWGAVFYFFSDDIVGLVHSYISYLPFGESINKILTNVGSTIVLMFLYYELVILSIGVFSSFFVDKITERINEKYYNLPTKKTSLIEGILVSLKGMVNFVLFFILTFYLLFIPVVNIIYQVFLWTLAIKKPLVFDSSAPFCDYKEFERNNNIKIWIIIFLTSFVYFVPILSFFGYTLQLIFMTHFVLSKCKKN
ncbi:EI24 domain-containing protein [Nautilia sp.]